MKDETNEHFADGNNFYVYGEFNESVIELVIKPFRKKIDELSVKTGKHVVNFYINSPGGDVHILLSLLGMFDECKANNIEVHTYIDGYAFSAGALLAISGHKRFGRNISTLMFHSARSWNFAHNEEMMKREQAFYSWLDNQFCTIIESNTKLKDVKKMIMSDSYYINGGKDLKKYGCIDEIC